MILYSAVSSPSDRSKRFTLSSPGRPVHPDTNSTSLGSILAMQQLSNEYSLTCPPLSIARYSFIQLSQLGRREEKENAQTSKRYQRGFEPGLCRLRVRHSTTELPRFALRLSVAIARFAVRARQIMCCWVPIFFDATCPAQDIVQFGGYG